VQAQDAVGAAGDGRCRVVRQSAWHDEAVIVVGVLAEQVHPSPAPSTPCGSAPYSSVNRRLTRIAETLSSSTRYLSQPLGRAFRRYVVDGHTHAGLGTREELQPAGGPANGEKLEVEWEAAAVEALQGLQRAERGLGPGRDVRRGRFTGTADPVEAPQ
jgi:hypothetical protein